MMKKILVLLVIIGLLLTSCSMALLDNDGFHLFSYYQFIDDGNVCVQSHDGYMVEGRLYNESVFDLPVLIENVSDIPIDVKITTMEKQEWISINPLETLLINKAL